MTEQREKPKELSNCCGHSVYIVGKTTNYYIKCSRCGKTCDVEQLKSAPSENERIAELEAKLDKAVSVLRLLVEWPNDFDDPYKLFEYRKNAKSTLAEIEKESV